MYQVSLMKHWRIANSARVRDRIVNNCIIERREGLWSDRLSVRWNWVSAMHIVIDDLWVRRQLRRTPHAVNCDCIKAHPTSVGFYCLHCDPSLVVGELTGVTMHPSGITPHAYFIVLQGLNFRKKIMLIGKNLGYRVLISHLLLWQPKTFSNKLNVPITKIINV